MRKGSRKLEDEELDEYAKERVDAVYDMFPDERLREDFGLNVRECGFVRAYAVLHNAHRSAMIAGYTYRVSRSAYRLLKLERIAKALEAIVSEAVNPVTKLQTAVIMKTTVSRLMKIIMDDRDAKASVMASKAMLDYIGSGSFNDSSSCDDDVKHDDVPDGEIEESLKRMGVISDG